MKCRSMLAVATLAAPLCAQQPGTEGSMMHPMGPVGSLGPVMMQMMWYMPQHLLAHKEALGLMPDQVTRLTALRDGERTAREAIEAEAEAHVKELDQAASAPQPDTVVLKTRFAAAHAAMGKAHWLALTTAVQAKSVLNDAQRKKVTVWADSMHAWMQQHRRMMPPSPDH
ncbi:MAG TPA: hypothetical protein VM716_04825 [Gemmatimonadales bacterium]|nr:hypothetical protein [Gemmatimonadales bacterium]